MRVMITGGGTGGHTSPAVAIIEELRRRDPKLLLQWVGRHGGFESRVCVQQDIPFRGLPVEGWPRKQAWRKPWVAAKLVWCMLRAALLLRAFRPQVVIGVGGYVSLPAMWTAQRMGIPTVLHEQNKRLGMANRLAAPRAERVFLSYEDTIGNLPDTGVSVVGNPVRPGFVAPPSTESAREAFSLDPAKPVLFVCGGSQGARSINKAVTEMLPVLAPNEFQLMWMTGPADLEKAREAVQNAPVDAQVFPYIEDMAAACVAASLVVSRAGASTTAELTALGKPALLIPYPYATDNHQEQNARALEAGGAAHVLLDQHCDGSALCAEVRDLLGDAKALAIMAAAAKSLGKLAAAELIAESIMELVFPV